MNINQSIKAFNSLGQEVRLKIIKELTKENDGLCPCDIIKKFNISNATLSFHLKELENANLVTKQKKGKYIYYYSNCQFIKELGDFLLEHCQTIKCNKGDK